jgi:lipopolysaccharide/colanic/teichoic acid biosynthesis glycosyltransferase
MKRVIDFSAAVFGGVVLSPLLAVVAFLVWLQDRRSPFYIAPRVARGGGTFNMVKFRSMVKNADRAGVDSTSANDQRITGIGRFIRRFKIDELPQLWNVAKGDMSLVGPRPNVVREVDLYTAEERHLLDARPGITDLASIVFADEGDILADKADPDIAYNQLIRPGKSRLGLFYVDNRTTLMDLRILRLTITNSLSRERALQAVSTLLGRAGAPDDLVRLATREDDLVAAPPPGSDTIVTTRDR